MTQGATKPSFPSLLALLAGLLEAVGRTPGYLYML